jgi:hypothetical protein
VAYLTLSIDGKLEAVGREAIDEVVRRQGGRIVWRTNDAVARSYGLVELPDTYDAEEIRAASQATVYDAAIIALAVFPGVPEALPRLLDALAGPGHPAGVLGCRPCAAGVVVEWDPRLVGARVVLGLIDVELGRFASGRRSELLSPLPPSIVAAIAAEGLQAPEIRTDRVLELLIGDHA